MGARGEGASGGRGDGVMVGDGVGGAGGRAGSGGSGTVPGRLTCTGRGCFGGHDSTRVSASGVNAGADEVGAGEEDVVGEAATGEAGNVAAGRAWAIAAGGTGGPIGAVRERGYGSNVSRPGSPGKRRCTTMVCCSARRIGLPSPASTKWRRRRTSIWASSWPSLPVDSTDGGFEAAPEAGDGGRRAAAGETAMLAVAAAGESAAAPAAGGRGVEAAEVQRERVRSGSVSGSVVDEWPSAFKTAEKRAATGENSSLGEGGTRAMSVLVPSQAAARTTDSKEAVAWEEVAAFRRRPA